MNRCLKKGRLIRSAVSLLVLLFLFSLLPSLSPAALAESGDTPAVSGTGNSVSSLPSSDSGRSLPVRPSEEADGGVSPLITSLSVILAAATLVGGVIVAKKIY